MLQHDTVPLIPNGVGCHWWVAATKRRASRIAIEDCIANQYKLVTPNMCAARRNPDEKLPGAAPNGLPQ